jgi:hypothetical protein
MHFASPMLMFFCWAAHRSAVWACNSLLSGSFPVLLFRQRFPCGRAAFTLFFRLFRVSACLNTAFASEQPGAEVKRKPRQPLLFQDTLRPVNRASHTHACNKIVNADHPACACEAKARRNYKIIRKKKTSRWHACENSERDAEKSQADPHKT